MSAPTLVFDQRSQPVLAMKLAPLHSGAIYLPD